MVTKPDKDLAFESITRWLEVGNSILEKDDFSYSEFEHWRSSCKISLPLLFGDSVIKEFDNVTRVWVANSKSLHVLCLKAGLALLTNLLHDLHLHVKNADKSFGDKCFQSAKEWGHRVAPAAITAAAQLASS